MNHVDPFAPADSPQHPANWTQQGEEEPVQPTPTEAMPRWISLPDEPVLSDNPDAAVIGDRRWEEYNTLLEQYGSPEHKAYRDEVTAVWPDDMPTLAELKAIHLAAQSGEDDDEEPTPEQADDEEAALRAALADLDDE